MIDDYELTEQEKEAFEGCLEELQKTLAQNKKYLEELREESGIRSTQVLALFAYAFKLSEGRKELKRIFNKEIK